MYSVIEWRQDTTGLVIDGERANAPRIVVRYNKQYFVLMQFDNRKKIIKLGLGPKTCDFKKMTAESISAAIMECITNDIYKKKALEISQKLQNSSGLEATIKLIEKTLCKL